MPNLMEVKNITMKFGSLVANEDVSFTIHENEIVSLIGPNGAGKTTLFNCITGFYKPFSGEISFQGRDITDLPPYEVCRRGIGRTFQIVQTLDEMTVEENVITGAFLHVKSFGEAADIAHGILEKTGLLTKKDTQGANLTIADRKRVEIARALATQPRLLMLDECMAGLNKTEIRAAMDLCLKLKEEGLSLLIVEHVMEAVMPISDRVVVLNAGRKITEGTPHEVVNDEEVIKAYLGVRYHVKSKES